MSNEYSCLELDHLPGDVIAPLQTLVRDQGSLFDAWNDADEHTEEEFRDRGLVPRIKMHMSRNALTTLPLALFALRNITILNVSSNSLTHLSPHIGKLENLARLDISSNRLRWLPWELIQLFRVGNLQELHLGGNPFFQPFPYMGPWHQFIYPSYQRPGTDVAFNTWFAPATMSELLQRLKEADKTLQYLQDAKLRGVALQDLGNVSKFDQRTLDQAIEHAQWMRHFYLGYTVKPLKIYKNRNDRLVSALKNPGKDIIEIFEEHWEDLSEEELSEELSEENLWNLREDWFESELEKVLVVTRQKVGAIHVASTSISVFGIDGCQAANSQNVAPSLLPVDELRLTATPGKDYFAYSQEDLAFPKPSGTLLKRSDEHSATNAVSIQSELSSCNSAAPSLFELALQSATKVSQQELVTLPSMLPEDAPDSVLRGLKTAVDAIEEGGRTCSVCMRPYVIPRTEWVEYWHIIDKIDARTTKSKNLLFLPFLRRGCSLKCVPGRNRDEEDLRVNLDSS